jgi:hypothetical protein
VSQAPNSPPPSDAALALAQRLFVREVPPNSADAIVVAGAVRICTRVADGLTRSFGPFGSLALLARALARAQTDHPALNGVAYNSVQLPVIAGLEASAELHGAQAVADGTIAMVARLTDAIGRLIGEDIAIKLLEQSITPSVKNQAIAANGDPRR